MKIYGLNAMRILMIPLFLLATSSAQSESNGRYEMSGHLNIVGASGKPSNDILGLGVIVHRKLSDEWYLGVSLENATDFDVERPNEELNIDSASETDALGTMNMITVVAERRFPPRLAKLDWILEPGRRYRRYRCR